MTEVTKTPISGELMIQIRKIALESAMHIAQIAQETAVAKVAFDASVLLNFLVNGMPVDSAPGYVTAPQPNTPEVLAATETPKAEKPKKAKLTAVTPAVQASEPVQTAPASAPEAPAATAPAPAATTTQVIPAPTTLQATADSLKALVQDEARGGRAAAVALLAKFGVTQLNQIAATKMAEFKAALDNAGKAAPATAAAPGSDLL